MGSGVAQAQECFAFQSGANTVRAEGITEAVGSIQLQCRAQVGFGLPPIGDEAVISIKLNTQITNATNDDGDMVMGLTYTDGAGPWVTLPLGTPTIIRGRVRKYSRTVAPRSRGLSPPTTHRWNNVPYGENGQTVTIGGIMANASALGDGEDVTAEVSVNGVMIKFSPIKLADVTTGLDITVTAATGLQCEAPSDMTKCSHHQVRGRFCERAQRYRFARGDFPRHSCGCDRDAEHDGNGNGTRHGRSHATRTSYSGAI